MPGDNERGSALLIVFVFAAMVAIMLYMEMPVAVFEAQRQKEQLLIDRGNEYKHAVKLFARKMNGAYPATIDQLENTNRMRFLRHRFADPFTGKDDWRLLHAGPGGVLIDSKVNPISATNITGAAGNTGTGTPGSGAGLENASGMNPAGNQFGSTQTAAANTSGFGSTVASGGDETAVQPVAQRRPPMQAAGNAAANGIGMSASQDPMAPLLPAGTAERLTNNAPNAANAPNAVGVNGNAGPGTAASMGAVPGALQAAAPGALPGQDQNAVPGAPNANGVNGPNAGDNSGNPPSPNDMLRNLASNPNPRAAQGQPTSAMGQMAGGGGLAGVASKAKGHGIKLVNNQSDYSLWEFYYDPKKDSAAGLTGMPGVQGMQGGAATPGGPNAAGVGAGPANQQGFFGTNSTNQSGFGANSPNQSVPPQSATGQNGPDAGPAPTNQPAAPPQ